MTAFSHQSKVRSLLGPACAGNEKEFPRCHLISFFFLSLFKKLFISFWMCWVSTVARGLSLVEASGATPYLQGFGFSLRWLLLL